MVVGLGGLGSISACYMAAAGVGRLTLVDRDRVTLENLNRQILYATADIGAWKADAAVARLSALNPECRLTGVRAEIDGANAAEIAGGADLILDGADTIETRFHLNRAAFEKGIPFIHGGIHGFDGMASSFVPGETCCFSCVFSEKKSSGNPAPAPRRTGPLPVLGPTAGMVAAIQSMEAIKYIIGAGDMLKNRLLRIRGLSMSVHFVHLAPDPACPVCGGKASAAHGND